LNAEVYIDADGALPFKFDGEGLIQRAALETLEQEDFGAGCEINVTLVNDSEIRALNSTHRGADEITDVLSFPMYEKEELTRGAYPERMILGDIVISAERTVSQAAEYGHGADRELAFLTVHGVLHLLGYDHETPGDEKTMEEKQEKILYVLNLKRGYL